MFSDVYRDCDGELEGIMLRNRREGRVARCDVDGDTQGGQKKNEQRCRAKRKRFSTILLNPLIYTTKKSNTKTSQKKY